MLSILPVLLSAALVVSPNTPGKHVAFESTTRHVRTTDAYLLRLLRAGVDRSPTFAGLVSRLEASDVIVYIQPVSGLPTNLAGRLLLLPLAGAQRYLRIQVTQGGSPNEMIALIGHELRHAVEVAEAGDVHDQESLTTLYQRIGERGRGEHLFDTLAAQAAGKRVRKELLA